ncbi:MAG: hypothetical protein NTV34_07795, partial [Proteobacteria bacterium]|nr:hypothetical protein [Pseudomonadota bacterium]
MTQRFKWLMIVLLPLVYGCSRRSDNSMVSLGERLNLKTFADKPDLAGRFVGQSVAHYVTRFVTVEEARRHSEDVMRHGGTLKLLDREGRVLSVTLPRKALDDLTVPVTALTSINSSISIRKAPVASGLNSENTGERSAVANDSMAFLTAREITGVSQLLKRFPDADGRNMKVAVFDTGIDFGVEGVDKNRDGSRKLVGFYDLTGFGKVALTDALSLDPPADSIDSKSFHYSVGGKSLTVPATLAKDVLMAG